MPLLGKRSILTTVRGVSFLKGSREEKIKEIFCELGSIMKFTSRFTTAASAFVLSVGLVTVAIASKQANAQTSYYWGSTELDSAVSVNLSVLDTLGEAPNLPGLLSPRAGGNVSPQLQQPRSSIAGVATGAALPVATPTANGMPQSGLTSMAAKPVSSAPVSSVVAAPKPIAATVPVPATPPKAEPQIAADPVPAPTPVPAPAPAAVPAPKVAESIEAPMAKPEPTPEVVAVAAPAAAPAPKEEMVEAASVVEAAPAPTPAAVPTPTAVPTAEVAKQAEEEQPKVALVAETPPEPAPKPVAKAEPEAPKQVAALPKVIDPNVVKKTDDSTVTVLFEDVATDLPKGAEGELDNIAALLKENPSWELLIEGYADVPNASPNLSRRTSLFRAISVRNYLVKQEVQSRRVKVRAFGNKADGGAIDRVDIFVKQK